MLGEYRCILSSNEDKIGLPPWLHREDNASRSNQHKRAVDRQSPLSIGVISTNKVFHNFLHGVELAAFTACYYAGPAICVFRVTELITHGDLCDVGLFSFEGGLTRSNNLE